MSEHHQQHVRSLSDASFTHSVRSGSSPTAPFASSIHAPSSSAIHYAHYGASPQHLDHVPSSSFSSSSRPSTATSIRTVSAAFDESPRHHGFCTMCLQDHTSCDRRRPCSRCVALRFECKYNQRTRNPRLNHHANPRPRSYVTNSINAPNAVPTLPPTSVHGQKEVEQLAGIADELNHALDREHEGQSGQPHFISSITRAQVETVTLIVEHTTTSAHQRPLPISWGGVVKTIQEASDKEAMKPQTQDDMTLLQPYTCSPEAIARWSLLQRKCTPKDVCDTKIQLVMKRLYSMHSYAIFEVDENDSKAAAGKRTKLWSLEEMQNVMMCTCSQKARTACLIIMCCFSLLHVYEVNMMAISRRKQSRSPTPMASSSVSTPSAPHRPAIPFSTIVLPPLPKSESHVKDIASYSAANQHIETQPDLTEPMPSVSQLHPNRSPPPLSAVFSPSVPEGAGSPPQSLTFGSSQSQASSLGYRPSHDALLHQTAPALASTDTAVPKKSDIDLRVISGFHHSMRFVNEVVVRYQTQTGMEASELRTGTDRTSEQSAPRGMALKLKEKLVQILEMLSSINMRE